MNEGRYPDKVINEAIKLLNKGMDPKDVADELREKCGYEKLHPKTLVRWRKKYPMGKASPVLPPQVTKEIREIAAEEARKIDASHGSPAFR